MTLEFKPIPKKALKFNIKGMTKDIRKQLEIEAKEHRRLLNQTTRTWKGTRPQMISDTVVSPTRIHTSTAPKGSKFGSEGASKWWWLEEGTSIRWALMSSGWRSKTRRGRLRSRSGRGRLLIAGRRAMTKRNIKPRPGIRARNWRAEVNKMRSRKFKGLLKRMFRIGAQNWIEPKALRR